MVEVDLRPQHPRRRLGLKVSTDDDIEEVADQLLGKDFFRRSGQIVRVAISVRYRGPADARAKTLSLCVSHPNNSNLRSLEEPSQRELASALLKEWKVLETFQPPSSDEQRALLPSLIELYALPADIVLGNDLKSRGLDVQDLARQGFIVRRGRHQVVLIEPDDEGPEEVELDLGAAIRIRWSTAEQTAGPRRCRPNWSISSRSSGPMSRRPSPTSCGPASRAGPPPAATGTLCSLASCDLPHGGVPCYLARGLEDRRVFERLDVRLRGENSGRRGIVLDAGDSGLSFLAAHVVLPLRKHLAAGGDRALDLDAIALAFDRLRQLARPTGRST